MATTSTYLTFPSGKNNPACGIKEYLDAQAAADPIFALKYMSGKKTIVGAIQYIMSISMKGHPSNVRCHLKELHDTSNKKFGFIDTDNDADNRLAYDYFLNDELDFEPKADPKKDTKPKPVVDTPEAKLKALENIKKSVQDFKPKTQAPTSKAQAKPSKATKPVTQKPAPVQTKSEDIEIDLFAGMFD